jgi:hypothetical protein
MNEPTYTERVSTRLHDIEPVWVGARCGCTDCGLADMTSPEDDEKRFASAGDLGFSWYRCDACNRPHAGERFAAHGTLDGEPVHLRVCTDCLFYIANGDIPEGES